ncbi:MAG TPA: serine hydrolase domain-containing protein, partial [Phormidium sp.]
GSITKTFTATVVMQLVEEGTLSLDATLDQYLPDTISSKIQNSDQITLQQLLSHSSGINSAIMDEFDQDMLNNPALAFEQWTPEQMLSRYTYDRESSFSPGTDIKYNNANYLLLELVVESATNSTLAYEVRERILEPLGLENTFFAEEVTPNDYQPSYIDIDNNGILDFNAGAVDLARFGGAGAMISNAEDLARFTKALFNGELVNPETVNEMITGGVSIPPEKPGDPEVGLGLGFAYRDVPGQGKELIMNGDDYGWSVRIRYDQNTGTVAVAMTNGSKIDDSQDPTTQAAEEILKTVLHD